MTPIEIFPDRIPHPHGPGDCPGGCDEIKTVEGDICKAKQDIDELNKRIQEGHDQMTRMDARFEETSSRIGRMETALNANTRKLDINTGETTEILQILRDSKAFFRVAGAAGTAVKWALGLCTAIAAFWLTIKAGWHQ